MQIFRVLTAPPPSPRASGGWGFASSLDSIVVFIQLVLQLFSVALGVLGGLG